MGEFEYNSETVGCSFANVSICLRYNIHGNHMPTGVYNCEVLVT